MARLLAEKLVRRRRQMMRVGVYAGAMLMACTTAIVVAQTKVGTPEEFDKAMKPAGPAMRNIGKMVASGGAVADVKKELAVLKAALTDTQSFWVLHKKREGGSGGRRHDEGSRRHLRRLPQAVPRAGR
jgi:hypothetical protein